MSHYRQGQCEVLLDELRGAGAVGRTRKQLAERLGIKKGKHLNGLIAELTTRDLAFVKLLPDEHNRLAFVYFDIGQLEVFLMK